MDMPPIKQQTLPVTTTVNMRFGPAMTALTEKQRAFVIAYNNAGGINASEAARAAGYASGHGKEWKAAHRQLHDPAVAAAMVEDAVARLRADLPETLDRIDKIARNPQDKNHFKALQMKAHHAGLIETVRSEHTEHLVLTYEQKLDRIKSLEAQLGEGKTIDAEYTEVSIDDLI